MDLSVFINSNICRLSKEYVFMRYSVLFNFLVFALLVGFCSSAFAEETTSLDRLEEKLNLDSIPADHIIVVDLSGSMNWAAIPGSRTRARAGARRYDFVLDALPDLLNAIPEGHYIKVLGFHDIPVGEDNPQLLRANWGASSDDISDLMDDIRANLIIGNDTDIGSALEAVHRVLTRSDHNRLQYVYMFTDGEHDPPVDSRYISHSDGWAELSANWQGLFNTCGTENSDREVLKIFMFGLFDVESAGVLNSEGVATNEDQMQFISFTDPQTLEASFLQTISNIRNDLVEASLETESRCGGWSISINLPEEIHPPCTLFSTVQSNFEHLETTGNLRISTTGNNHIECTLLSTEVHLLPNESVSIPILVDFNYTISGFFKKQVKAAVVLRLESYDTELESNLLNNAGFGGLVEFESTSCVSEIEFLYNDGKMSKWIILIPVLIIILIAYFVYRMYPRAISGNLQWFAVPDEHDLPQNRKIAGKGTVRIDSNINTILPANFLTIVCRPDSLLGRQNYLQVDANGVLVNGKRVTKGSEVKLKRACNISYNDESIEMKLTNIRSN